jgi:hypothetical protein
MGRMTKGVGVIVGVALGLLPIGCGERQRRVAVSPDGKAVLRDVLDGRLDQPWSCGSLRAAIQRLPPDGGPTYSPIPEMLEHAAVQACGRG